VGIGRLTISSETLDTPMYPKLRIGFAPAASHALTLITKILFLKLDCYPLESKSCYLYPMAFHGRSREAQHFGANDSLQTVKIFIFRDAFRVDKLTIADVERMARGE
jgi:hypothetical protein